MLGIELRKGDPRNLSGRLLAFARLEAEPEPSMQSPLSGMVRNGFLAVTGNFVEQHSLRDFLRKEFNADVEEGLSGLVDRLKENGDIPEELQGDELRKKLENFGTMEIIPVPAKLVFIADESEAMAWDGDVYWLGAFRSHPGAHLAVTSFPILYQAAYREQCSRELDAEISQLLGEVESTPTTLPSPRVDNDPAVLHLDGELGSFHGHLLELLTEQVVPNLVYNLASPIEYRQSIANFRRFMRKFRWPDEIARFERLVLALKDKDDSDARGKIERQCRRISALHHEEFEQLRGLSED